MSIVRIKFLMICLLAITLNACKSGPFNLIKPASPHEQYERKLMSSGLSQTKMGTMWINNAQESLQKALPITLPYQEKGYFPAEKVEAVSFKFSLLRGQKLLISLTKKPVNELMIYLDVLEQAGTSYKLWAAADTLGSNLQLDVEKTGTYILRLQPELLVSGEYTLSITTGPSLGYPLKTSTKNQIQSFFGAGRDDNTRKHEGIDIFSAFRTPVVAVARGTVTGVNSNNLGGKVVWFRPEGKDYTLYYAHLDEQTVSEGQSVLPGDTLGRMGNTGNAKTTPPHLHFGIYANGGAIDPLPFINPVIQTAPQVYASITQLNATMRTATAATLNGNSLKSGTILRVTAASGNDYRVELPDGQTGYLSSKSLIATSKAMSNYKAKTTKPVFDRPEFSAAVKFELKAGQSVSILGNFGDFQLVLDGNDQTGWINK